MIFVAPIHPPNPIKTIIQISRGCAGCVANAEPLLVAGISNVPDTVRMDAKTIEAVYHDVVIVWEDGAGGI